MFITELIPKSSFHLPFFLFKEKLSRKTLHMSDKKLYEFESQKVHTSWGTDSLVRATLLMLEEAISNPDNSHFILLSESQIPLMSFDEMFEKLGKESHFYMDNWLWQKNNLTRAFPKNVVKKSNKADQWMMLTRKAAKFFVENTHYLSQLINLKDIAVDERYFVELMDVNGLTWKNQCSTYCNWNTLDPPKKFDVLNKAEWKKARKLGCMFLRQVNPKKDMGNEIIADIARNSKAPPRTKLPQAESNPPQNRKRHV